ncbi:polysialyltransferase family glycosyltransferase [Vibrio coralliirubri]|uniref:polysialyltransferase family glycosyltransferase n=1 Tax=Vibrio coralliirubri TaxID=1516159 RepID=UPI002FE3F6AD
MSHMNTIIYSSGGFCDVMACAALSSNNRATDNQRIIFMLNTVDNNADFERKTIKNIKKLLKDTEVTIDNIYNYCDDENIKTLDSDKLQAKYDNVSSVYLYAESSGLRIDCFFRAFEGSEFIVYEEGMLGYCADIYHNSELGGLSLISKYYTTNYFGKLLPQSLRQTSFKIKKYDEKIVRDYFTLIDPIALRYETSNYHQSVMMISAPLWRMGPLSYIDVLYAHVTAVNKILASGVVVYFKDHPRPEAKLFSQIHRLLEDDFKERFIDVSDVAMLAESIVEHIKPDAVVGFGSTVLFNAPHFYNVPSFRFSTELVAYSLGAKRQHLLNCVLKCQYIPHLDSLINVLNSNHDDKRSEIKIVFNSYLDNVDNSLENSFIDSVYNSLFIENIKVNNEIDIIRNVLNDGEVGTAKKDHLRMLLSNPILRYIKKTTESLLKIKICRQESYLALKEKNQNDANTIDFLLGIINKDLKK